ncbi:ABC transporter permease [Jiangella endophytica]|uniref:ABC transporter permease n=1 Tax=Jiangella endophytica TaxID=1623398 RepID=UPI000E356035|nr:ABC transporter permease [Jiangella endophytica]
MTRRTLLAIEIVCPALAVLAIAIFTSRADSYYFPPLSGVVQSFADIWLSERLVSDLLPSMQRMAIAYAICVVAGVGAGMVLARTPRLMTACEPILEFLRALPGPALIPFGILLFGIGDTMKIFIIVLGAIWPILMNTVDGVRGVDPALLHMARVYRLPRRVVFSKIILRSASPRILAGMRTALSLTIILMVVSEMVGSTNGVGFSVLQAQRTFAVSEMWSGILLLGLIGFLANLAFLAFEKRALFWMRQR